MSVDDLFSDSVIRDAVLIRPQRVGSNFREVIEQQLRVSTEGVCTRHGFIRPGSLALTRVLAARVETVSLNGDVRFDVHYAAQVCNPAIGAVFEARVVNMNRFAVLAHSGEQRDDGTFLPVIESIITRQTLAADVDVAPEDIAIGDVILVEVLGKKFELGDRMISVIGRALKSAADATRVASAAAAGITVPLSGDAAAPATSDDGEDDRSDGQSDDSDEGEGEGSGTDDNDNNDNDDHDDNDDENDDEDDDEQDDEDEEGDEDDPYDEGAVADDDESTAAGRRGSKSGATDALAAETTESGRRRAAPGRGRGARATSATPSAAAVAVRGRAQGRGGPGRAAATAAQASATMTTNGKKKKGTAASSVGGASDLSDGEASLSDVSGGDMGDDDGLGGGGGSCSGDFSD